MYKQTQERIRRRKVISFRGGVEYREAFFYPLEENGGVNVANGEVFSSFVAKGLSEKLRKFILETGEIFQKNFQPIMEADEPCYGTGRVEYIKRYNSIRLPVIYHNRKFKSLSLVIEIFPFCIGRIQGEERELTSVYSNFRFTNATDERLAKKLIECCYVTAGEINKLIFRQYVKLFNEFIKENQLGIKEARVDSRHIHRTISLLVGSSDEETKKIISMKGENSKKQFDSYLSSEPLAAKRYLAVKSIWEKISGLILGLQSDFSGYHCSHYTRDGANTFLGHKNSGDCDVYIGLSDGALGIFLDRLHYDEIDEVNP